MELVFIFVEVGDNGVLTDIKYAEYTGGTSLLCQKGKAVLYRLSGVAVLALLAVKLYGA